MTTTSHNHKIAQPKDKLPRILLHVEGVAVMVTAVYLYSQLNASWGMFFLLFLVPDFSFLGYLYSTQLGSALYNFVHSYTTPLLIGIGAMILSSNMSLAIAIIWLFHIGMDRAVGYGLKYSDAFKHTHLGEV